MMRKANCAHTKHHIVSAVFCLSMILISCGSSQGDLQPPGFYMSMWIYLYLPYVESVEVPENIKANEAFNITVKLSAVLNPDILRGLDPDKHKPAIIYDPSRKPGIGVSLSIYEWDILPEGDYVDELVLEAPPLNEGEYFLLMTSADSREWGGLDLSYEEVSHTKLNPEHQKHKTTQEFSFTVLPADAGGGGA